MFQKFKKNFILKKFCFYINDNIINDNIDKR